MLLGLSLSHGDPVRAEDDLRIEMNIEQAMRGVTARFPEASILADNPDVVLLDQSTPEAARHALRISRKAYERVAIRDGAWQTFKMFLDVAKEVMDLYGLKLFRVAASDAVDIVLLWVDSSTPGEFGDKLGQLILEKAAETGVSALTDDELAGALADKLVGLGYDSLNRSLSAQTLEVATEHPMCGQIPISAWFTRAENGAPQVRFSISGDCGCKLPDGDPVKLGAFSVYGAIPIALVAVGDPPSAVELQLRQGGEFRISADHRCEQAQTPPAPPPPTAADQRPIAERICDQKCRSAKADAYDAANQLAVANNQLQRLREQIAPLVALHNSDQRWVQELNAAMSQTPLAANERDRLLRLAEVAKGQEQRRESQLAPLRAAEAAALTEYQQRAQALQVARSALADCKRTCYAAAPAGDGGPLLRVSPTKMKPDQSFNTHHVSLWGKAEGAWIGMHSATSSTRSGLQGLRRVLQRRDLQDDVQAPATSVSGEMSWQAPSKPGAYEMRLYSGKAADSLLVAVAPFEVTANGPAIRVTQKRLEHFAANKFRPVWWLTDASGAPLKPGTELLARQIRTYRDSGEVWEHVVKVTVMDGGIASYPWYWNASRPWADVASFQWTLLADPYPFTPDSIETTIKLD